MNKFLKLAVIPVAFLIAGTTTSCSISPREIALITDVGDIDDGSFNQESWEAVKEYATKNHKTYDFYRPFNDSDFARSCAIKQAVAKGAQIIVLPGFKFASTCMNVMDKYPKVHFLLIDSNVNDGLFPPTVVPPSDNVCCVGFKCEYSGFIAGYTIAQDLMIRDWVDNDKLNENYGYGYAGGMATSGVFEFGFGYIQGICKATADFCDIHNIIDENKPRVLINYTYAGVFAQDDATAAKVKGWYSKEGKDNIKVVFPCGGKLYQSVTEAAQYYNKHQPYFNYNAWVNGQLKNNPRKAARWVGVDSDQYRGLKYDYEKRSIYTSALKGLNPAIMHALDIHYQGDDTWKKLIGGDHHESENPGCGEVGADGKWVLGLHSIFGDYETATEDIYDSYVGIPEEHDEKTQIMRGFDKFVFEDEDTDYTNDFKSIYERLIGDDPTHAIEVYGGDGSEWTIGDTSIHPEAGYPTDMDKWVQGTTYYRTKYLGNYPEAKIDIKVL